MKSNIENPKLVTVGITTYDRPDTLRQTIQSVLHQTYENLEILVIDDYSLNPLTDKVADEFIKKDKRIQYIKQSQNKGVEANFNELIKKSKGEYFMWLCDDDWIDNSYIQRCLEFIIENPDYILVSGKTRFYWDKNFAYDGAKIDVEEETGFARILSFYNKQLGTANCPNFGIIKRALIENLYLKHILGHDNVFIANLAFLGKIKIIDDVCIHRRLGGTSESLKKSALIFKHSFFEANVPFLALWKNIFVDIAWEGKVYTSIGLFERLNLALTVTGLIIFKMREYFERYKKRQTALLRQKL